MALGEVTDGGVAKVTAGELVTLQALRHVPAVVSQVIRQPE